MALFVVLLLPRRAELGRPWVRNSPPSAISFFHPSATFMIAALLGVAVFGGMFVVPLYAFLTTTVDKSQTARTVAANNIVNSGAMVVGSVARLHLEQLWRRPCRTATFGRGNVRCRRLAWLEAPPGVRLGEVQGRKKETAGEGHCKQPEIVDQRGAGQRLPGLPPASPSEMTS